MSQKKCTYYVGRVLKLGMLKNDNFFNALKNPKAVSKRGYSWTLVDVKEYWHENYNYIFGKLCKYSPDAEVKIVDTVNYSELRQPEPNLQLASSPFLYIPEFSGITFLSTSGSINKNLFISSFCEIIKTTFDNLFIDCEIELISDMRTFAQKLNSLEYITKLDARISPPNPLFSPLWGSLKRYLENRNMDKLTIVEDASKDKLNTRIKDIVNDVSEGEDLNYSSEVEVGDAAILMAADGYGEGVVTGKKENIEVSIKTSETNLNFQFDKDPDVLELFMRLLKILKGINDDRSLKH